MADGIRLALGWAGAVVSTSAEQMKCSGTDLAKNFKDCIRQCLSM